MKSLNCEAIRESGEQRNMKGNTQHRVCKIIKYAEEKLIQLVCVEVCAED